MGTRGCGERQLQLFCNSAWIRYLKQYVVNYFIHYHCFLIHKKTLWPTRLLRPRYDADKKGCLASIIRHLCLDLNDDLILGSSKSSCLKSGQKWLKNYHLATITKVQFESLRHSVVLSSTSLTPYYRVGENFRLRDKCQKIFGPHFNTNNIF